jgi:CubicO group peptidase (beta-lactamase class C family)
MKRWSLLLIFFSLITVSPEAQKILPATKPEDAGFSSERLKKLDAALEEWVAKEWAPGYTALVIRNGRIAYYRSVGFDDVQRKTPLKKDAIYRIASQTKAITSVAIMMLFDEGKLQLDDAVSKYIPAFKKQSVLDKFNAADSSYTTVPAKKEITIRELLTHTSGIGYAQIGTPESNAIYAKARLTSGVGVENDTLLSAMKRLAALPLMHQPGEKWTYGLNTDLLGALVEVISGMSLDEYFRTKIFQPLGMSDTYFEVPTSKAPRLVKLYKEESGNKYVEASEMVLNNKVDANYPLKHQTYFSGGAGLSSSILDYGIFLQMLLNGGVYDGKRILGRNTVRMMTTNQINRVPFGGRDRFGLGFQLVTDSSAGQSPANVGTYSWGGAFATSYWVDPKEKMVILFYRQLWGSTHGDVVGKFRALVYQALLD